MGVNYDGYERHVMACKQLEKCVMDVNEATYGHATMEGIGLRCTWKMGM